MTFSRSAGTGTCALACGVAAFVMLCASPAAAQRRTLFSDDPGVQPANRPAANRPRAVLRTRQTSVDLTQLTAAGSFAPRGFSAPVTAAARSVALNLFQDADYVAAFDHVENVSDSSYAWVGDVVGRQGSRVVLAVADGTFAGKVTLDDASYSIVPDGSGGYAINQIDPSQLPMDAGGVARERTTAVPFAAPGPAPAPDAGDTFDLLLYYTTGAKNAAGGAAAMNAHITLAIAEMNTAYTNSLIPLRVRLVATLESGYVDTGNVYTDLDALESSASVAAARNQYGADLVAMIVGRQDPCCSGLGDLKSANDITSVNEAFSVEVFYSYIAGIYALTHELGHNQGADHEPGNGCPGLFSYSCGYVDIPHRFHDLMAYGLNCNSCTEINYFSNPLVTYNGFPTGTATQDNARTLTNSRVSVANYRQSLGTTTTTTTTTLGPPTNLTVSSSGNSVTLSWGAPATGTATAYIIEAGSATGLSNLASFNTGSSSRTFSTSGVGNGSYYVRVKATDGTTISAASNEALLVVGSTGCSAAPSAPTLTSSVSGRTVSLSWTASSGATSYSVEAGTSPGSSNAAVVDNGTSTSLVASSVGAGTYYIRVKARNTCGTSAASNEATVVVR